MQDARVDLILATGGPAVVEAAYRSGHPAIGVGPGNAPVFVDATADLAAAARRIVESSRSTTRSSAPTSSVVLATSDRRPPARRAAARRRRTSAPRTSGEAARLLWFRRARFNVAGALGKDAATSPAMPASRSRRARSFSSRRSTGSSPRSRSRARSCARCSASPASPTRGQAAVRRPRHDAHRRPRPLRRHPRPRRRGDPGLRQGDARPARRRQRAAVARAPPASIPTWPDDDDRHRLRRRLALGENLRPEHLVNWTRIAYPDEAAEPMGDFEGLTPWRSDPLPAETRRSRSRRATRRAARPRRARGRRLAGRPATGSPRCATRSGSWCSKSCGRS